MNRPFRLTAPVTPEHSLQKQVCDTLRLEIAPAGKLSRDGVTWYAVDHANYAGEVPGIRVGRGIVAGVPDLFVLWGGHGHFIELKTEAGALSDAQQAVATALLLAGGKVGVASTVEQVLLLLDAWQVPRARRVRIAA